MPEVGLLPFLRTSSRFTFGSTRPAWRSSRGVWSICCHSSMKRSSLMLMWVVGSPANFQTRNVARPRCSSVRRAPMASLLVRRISAHQSRSDLASQRRPSRSMLRRESSSLRFLRGRRQYTIWLSISPAFRSPAMSM
ncbi:hypothetical protein CBQ26_00770 [Deinococcus indicus]|uniref:Uncharacterized protein n=1 Tax=Deinococcus indicus TaxID=223556 RepID=A0A246BTM0_9DEIO|nr:hypothetical protein CBQ26_00770 [Deinococcus indicus]